MKPGGAIRPCGKRYRTEAEARCSKRGLLPAAMVIPCVFAQCGGWHVAIPKPASTRPAPARKPLPLVSKKRTQLIRERRAMLQAKYPGITLCEVPFCNRIADDAHEPLTRARGGSITDPDNVKAVCRPHHDEITFEEPEWAYDLGFLKHSWPERGSVMAS